MSCRFQHEKITATVSKGKYQWVFHQPAKRLLELPGIGKKRQERVSSAWAEQKVIREIMVFLQSNGVGTSRSVRIYKTYGDQAIDKVRENPYRLALDIHGIGFKTADTLAQKLGIGPQSMLRAQAGVQHVLQEWSGEGHCAAIRSNLCEMAAKLLEIPLPIMEQAIAAELTEGNLIAEIDGSKEFIFLTPLHRAEIGCAAHLNRLNQGDAPWGVIDADKAIPWVEGQTGMTLSQSQASAVRLVLQHKVSVITGGPGVGKTNLVNSLLRILKAKRVRIGLCAPTGRAAKRLTESTSMEAKTVHRLLEFDPTQFAFKHNDENPLDLDCLVIDESSMMTAPSVGRIMRLLGFTPQKPLYRAWQQNPVLVEKWQAEEFPALKAEAKRTGAVIYFADEASVRLGFHAGKTWALVGRPPTVKTTGRRFGLNLTRPLAHAATFASWCRKATSPPTCLLNS